VSTLLRYSNPANRQDYESTIAAYCTFVTRWRDLVVEWRLHSRYLISRKRRHQPGLWFSKRWGKWARFASFFGDAALG
jgi:hypothetical protein